MLVSYLSANRMLRCIGVDSTSVLEEAYKIHKLSQVAAAALGRTLTGALIMTRHLKNENDNLSIQIKGDGPLGGLIAITTFDCKVRGYVDNPETEFPLKNGKLDVGGAVGKGNMTVIKDMGMKEPYIGTVPLVSGEIAEDLAYYLANSEQIPSIIALGVLVSSKHIIASGGFMIQPLPGTDETVIADLEQRILSFPSITTLFSSGAGIDDILKRFMDGYDMEKIEEVETHYSCNCSKDRIERALISLGSHEIRKMIEDGKGAEVKCHFCNTDYIFDSNDLTNLL